jgi:penicillin-binding protein 2
MPRLEEFSVRPADPFHPHARRRRAWTVVFAMAATLLFLTAAFFRTQILRNYDFTLRADDNRLRVEPIPAPRGTVFDRDGQIVAETVTGYSLLVEPGDPDAVHERVMTAVTLLGLDTAAVERVVERAATSRGAPVVLVPSLSFEQVSILEERRSQLAGLLLETRPVRRYPAGPPVAHIVGYVLEIDDRELQSREWEGYRAGQLIGKSGVERQYERSMGGKAGSYFVEVDARGRVIGRFAERISTPPEAGGDIHLTLDLDLQRYAHQIFPEGMRGSIVAMAPSTGEVLALYSAPTYDPNVFVGGVSGRDWQQLNVDPSRPLLNRAIAGIYPPGSTWKLATAMVGLEKGAITPEQTMPLACTGGMSYAGRYSRCWKREGHGRQNLVQAVANSCNVYFYQLGIRIGLRDLTAQGTRLGFSRRTGIDLPGERPGTFPDGSDWYVNRFGWRPQPSEVMNVSIGQGPNSQTPLRMAQFFSAIAGDGTARQPHLLAGVQTPVETDLMVSRSTLLAAREGLARVMEGGTASRSRLVRWRVYGKTGTAQNSEDPERHHAWFTGFGGPRGGEPEIAVAVIVEFGESGSGVAAPLASQIIDFYLNKKYGFPNPELAEANPVRAGATRG